MTEATPSTTLDVLVEGLFDYAGMYPPAGLSFDAALKSSLAFPLQAARPAIKNSDLVLDTPNFKKLVSAINSSPALVQDKPLKVSLLGAPLKRSSWEDSTALTDRAAHDEALHEARNQPSERVQILSYEVRVEHDILEYPEKLVAACRSLLESLPDERTVLALEPNLSISTWRDSLERCASVISQLKPLFPLRTALKVRGVGSAGSGTTGIANQRIVHVLRIVALLHFPLKATAGLHHPIIEPVRYANRLGFMNLCTALMLALAFGEKIPDSEILSCLDEEDASAFSFGNSLRWKQWEVSLEELRAYRKLVPITIGSCSLEEPDADLVRLFGR